MDPDFFEVVMGADGTLKCFPVTEQADAEVTICSEKRARERFPGLIGSYVAPALSGARFARSPEHLGWPLLRQKLIANRPANQVHTRTPAGG
jgi:hypothetical protein